MNSSLRKYNLAQLPLHLPHLQFLSPPFKATYRLTDNMHDHFVAEMDQKIFDIRRHPPPYLNPINQADSFHSLLMTSIRSHDHLSKLFSQTPRVHAYWRTAACRRLKSQIAQQLRSSPDFLLTPEFLTRHLKYSLLRQEEDGNHFAACSAKVLQQVEQGDPRFWRSVWKPKISLQQQDPDVWVPYVEKLYNSSEPQHQQHFPLPPATTPNFFKPEQVTEAIKTMKRGKALDEFGLTIDYLKLLDQDPLGKILARIFNECVYSGRLPDEWTVRKYWQPLLTICCSHISSIITNKPKQASKRGDHL